jgi:hypothetical protein
MVDTSKRGEVVILREFNGNPIVGRVWACVPGAVLINDDQNFSLRERGELALGPVGFPVEDVFRYEEQAITKLQTGEVDWSAMESWG